MADTTNRTPLWVAAIVAVGLVLAGGAVGVFLGVPFPVPIVGSLVGGLAGTFAGAALVTYRETRRVRSAGRVGWGTLIGRGFAAAAKTAAGVVVLVVGATSLILR